MLLSVTGSAEVGGCTVALVGVVRHGCTVALVGVLRWVDVLWH